MLSVLYCTDWRLYLHGLSRHADHFTLWSALHIRAHSFHTPQTLRSLTCDDIIFLIAPEGLSSDVFNTTVAPTPTPFDSIVVFIGRPLASSSSPQSL